MILEEKADFWQNVTCRDAGVYTKEKIMTIFVLVHGLY